MNAPVKNVKYEFMLNGFLAKITPFLRVLTDVHIGREFRAEWVGIGQTKKKIILFKAVRKINNAVILSKEMKKLFQLVDLKHLIVVCMQKP